MGSGKKHKKDKKHATEKADPELRKLKKEKKKHKKKEKKQKKEKRNRASSSPEIVSDRVVVAPEPSRRVRVALNDPPPDRRGGSSNAGEIALSVEDTNKLREKLGLKPLEIDKPKSKKTPRHHAEGESARGRDSDKQPDAGTVVSVDGETFVHKRAESWTEAKRQAKIRERLQAMREKRQFSDKLAKVRGLGEASEVDSAADWVTRSRKLADDRKRAAEREALITEMDAEFGVGDIVAEEMVKSGPRYNAGDLAGLKVDHSKEAFIEGKDTILVLKDRGVLEDGDDEEILINPTMETKELWEKNADIRKGRSGYNPYSDLAEGEDGMDVDVLAPPKKSLLAKYDAELEGEQKKGFSLDSTGSSDLKVERRELAMKEKLKLAAQSLRLPEMELAKEYYTKEEMAAKFKKPKKLKKVRKFKTLKADDLLDIVDTPSESLGSRDVRGGDSGNLTVNIRNSEPSSSEPKVAASNRRKASETLQNGDVKMDIDYSAMLESFEQQPSSSNLDDDNDDIYAQPLDDDPLDQELAAELARSRRIKALSRPAQPEMGVNLDDLDSEEAPSTSSTGPRDDKSVVLDSISEYCRGIGDIPTFGTSGNRTSAEVPDRDPEDNDDAGPDSDDESMTSSNDEDQAGSSFAKLDGLDSPARGHWKPAIGSDDEKSDHEVEDEDDGMINILDEPDGSLGIAGTLKLAMQKQLLEAGPGRKGTLVNPKLREMEAKRYSIMNKQYTETGDAKAAAGSGPRPQGDPGQPETVEDGSEALLDHGQTVNVLFERSERTLKLAMQKQLLEAGPGRKGTLVNPKLREMEAKRYSIMDKQFDDIDSKYARKLERLGGGGPIQEFKEKNSYNPNFKLEYADETGRHMSEKEAFQYLSWKFHGKKPGKGKMEKKMKRRQQEALMQSMSSTDTPLGTVEKQLRKQEEMQSPFIMLSGSGKDAAFSQIRKD